jgi:hypothetical protein
MVYSVQVQGVLNSNQAFDARFIVPAKTDVEAVRMLESEMDWSEAKTLTMVATPAVKEDVHPTAHRYIVRKVAVEHDKPVRQPVQQ